MRLDVWTQEEKDTLRRVFRYCAWGEIHAALPKRSRGAIESKASELKITRADDTKNAERVASGLKGSKVAQMRQSIKRTLRHPLEAAWRGM